MINGYQLICIQLLILCRFDVSLQESFKDRWLEETQSDYAHDNMNDLVSRNLRIIGKGTDLDIDEYPNVVAIIKRESYGRTYPCFGILIEKTNHVLVHGGCFASDQVDARDYVILYNMTFEPFSGVEIDPVHIRTFTNGTDGINVFSILTLEWIPRINLKHNFVIPSDNVDLLFVDENYPLIAIGFGWLYDLNWGRLIKKDVVLFRDRCESVISPFEKSYELCGIYGSKGATCGRRIPEKQKRDCEFELFPGAIVYKRNWLSGPDHGIIAITDLYPENCQQNNFIDKNIAIFQFVTKYGQQINEYISTLAATSLQPVQY